VGLNGVPITHPPEKRALAGLLLAGGRSGILPVSREEIGAAREDAGGSMGW
jgi:hypothetical protein